MYAADRRFLLADTSTINVRGFQKEMIFVLAEARDARHYLYRRTAIILFSGLPVGPADEWTRHLTEIPERAG